MKSCPKCDQTYNDGTLNFCLLDGTALLDSASEPTVVIPTPDTFAVAPTANPRRWWLTALAVAALMLVGAGLATAGFLIYLGWPTETARVAVRESPTPSSAPRSPRPQPSPNSTPARVSEEKPSLNPAAEDEVTPIRWTTTTGPFQGETGKTFRFECPENGVAAAVWGSDIYTSDSSICTAAVHAGIITLESGGEVTVEFRPGRATYGSTERNGITTNTFGEHYRSFVVR